MNSRGKIHGSACPTAFSFLPTTTTAAAMDARAPPFSLLEFGDLVSAALASPDIPPLASALPVPREFTTAPTVPTTRRSLLSRVKHALTLVSLRSSSTTHPRRAASEPARELPRRRARSPAYRIPELQRLSSFNAFDTTNPKDASAFEPAVPLVMQYERVYGLSVPSLPSYSAHSSSPSPSSAYYDSTPPTSTSSCSSASSYPPTPSTLSPVVESTSEDACTSRWSLSSHACSEAEPVFLTKPTQTPTPPPTLRRRRTRLSFGLGLRLHLLPPAKPVPVCPLPPLPSHASLLPFSQPSFDAFSSPSAFSHVASRHTFTAPTPTPTAHPGQRASRSLSLRSVRSLPFSLSRSPLHDEETRSLTTRAQARPSARSGRRAPVPSLLDAFPVPPSSLPSSPHSSPSKSVKSASSSPSKRPRSPFPFRHPFPIPGAYPPSPPRFFPFDDDDGDFEEEDEEGEDGDVFHSACSDAF
ncbi:hypothetical protein C8R46DRAFT_1303014 [Mycena filopes]|nr:hypothetical protein C8R46DRAFT_1303014 [Mycena filopes]